MHRRELQFNLHPHVHALVTRGGWPASGEWVSVPNVDPSFAEQLFRHKVIRLLQRECLLDEDRTRLPLSWRHSGFSVHNIVTVPAGDGRALEALARYCLRDPVSLARLRWAPGSATATFLPSAGHDDEKAVAINALDFVARLLAHVPNPRRILRNLSREPSRNAPAFRSGSLARLLWTVGTAASRKGD